jgi:hypothetical protein
MSSRRSWQGKPISQQEWPASGARRDWLTYCDRVHRANGMRSLSVLATAMGLTSRTRVGELLRGLSLPADERQAAYWKKHFDLSSIVATNWTRLGPKIAGRLRVYVGTEDTYFLNDGVTYFEQRTDALTSTKPHFQFIYGVSQPHGWTR